MFPFANIQAILIAIVVSLSVGFGTGFYTERQFTKAGMVSAVIKVQKANATEVKKSAEASTAVEAKVSESIQKVESIRKDMTDHFKLKEKVKYEQSPIKQSVDAKSVSDLAALPEPVEKVSCDWNLDVGTVGMLNSARAGSSIDPASVSDAASQAPSSVGVEAFIDNDLQVIEMYHDLATRHDALVDYVNSLLKKQAE
jgi:hypothetical protein